MGASEKTIGSPPNSLIIMAINLQEMQANSSQSGAMRVLTKPLLCQASIRLDKAVSINGRPDKGVSQPGILIRPPSTAISSVELKFVAIIRIQENK